MTPEAGAALSPDMGLVEFLARARAIESDARDRYEELADQMEVHNNLEVAALFRRMAEIEGAHLRRFEEHAGAPPELREAPALAPWRLRWEGSDAPETVAGERVHYRMTPWHALSLVLECERRAHAFFSGVARAAVQPEVRALAAEYAAEEGEHVRLAEQWLSRYPPPEPGWDEDPDPPLQPD